MQGQPQRAKEAEMKYLLKQAYWRDREAVATGRRSARSQFLDFTGRNQLPSRTIHKMFNEVVQERWPKIQVNAEDVIEFLDRCGIKRKHRGEVRQPSAIREDFFDGWMAPPKSQASAGFFFCESAYKEDAEIPCDSFRGAKGKSWAFAQQEAGHLWDVLGSYGLTWAHIEDERMARYHALKLALRFKWVFMTAFRTDGGPEKGRHLKIGTAPMFIIESKLYQDLHEQMLDVAPFGYRRHVIDEYFANARAGKPLLCGDIISYDNHQSPELMKAGYKGVAQYMGWPESIAVALYLYATYTPVLIIDPRIPWSPNRIPPLIIVLRNGKQPSGIGGFSFMNSIILGTVIMIVTDHLLSRWDPMDTILQGDDHVTSGGVGVLTWIAHVFKVAGLPMDKVDTFQSGTWSKFLRNGYRRARNESYERRMVVSSRIRNGLMPERDNIMQICPELRALIYRSQALEYQPWVTPSLPEELRESYTKLVSPEIGLWDEYPTDFNLAKMYDEMRGRGLSDSVLFEAREIISHHNMRYGRILA